MKINVKAHPKSKFEKVIEHEGVYNCYFNVAPVGGRANKKVVEMLSDYLKVPKSEVEIKLGEMHTEKVVEIRRDLE